MEQKRNINKRVSVSPVGFRAHTRTLPHPPAHVCTHSRICLISGVTILRYYRVPRYKVIRYDTRYKGHYSGTRFGTVDSSRLMFGT